MPMRDGTGPNGLGSRAGRGMGNCPPGNRSFLDKIGAGIGSSSRGGRGKGMGVGPRDGRGGRRRRTI